MHSTTMIHSESLRTTLITFAKGKLWILRWVEEPVAFIMKQPSVFGGHQEASVAAQ